jgi:hypothetical protein
MKMRTVDSTGPRTRTTSRRRSRSASTAVTVAAVALLTAACGGDDGDSTTAGPAAEGAGSGDSGGSGESGEGEAEGLTVDITAPDDQADVGDPFELELATSVELGDPGSAPYHVHLYYDGATGNGEYDMVFATTFSVERDLGPGEHTLEAVVVNADHSPTDAKDEITVTVGAPTEAPADDEEDDSGYGYGY